MSVPTLTPEQRSKALAKARQVRSERGLLLQQVTTEQVTIADVLLRDDDIATGVRVEALLRALPKIGAVKTAKLLQEAGIHDRRRVGGLTDGQKARLLDVLA